jgi:hypothetical protein
MNCKIIAGTPSLTKKCSKFENLLASLWTDKILYLGEEVCQFSCFWQIASKNSY